MILNVFIKDICYFIYINEKKILGYEIFDI